MTTAGLVAFPSVLRVLHLVAPAPAGGLESVVLQLSRGFAAAGHDARVAVILDPSAPSSHPFVEALQDAGLTVHRIAVAGRAYRDERRQVRELLARCGSHVLHTHGYRPDVVDGPVARSGRSAHVMTLHGFVGGGWRDRLYEWMQVRAARHADAAIAVSTPIAARIAGGRPLQTVHVVPNAVSADTTALARSEARAALAVPDEAFVVGWIGRMSDEKDPSLFVEAVARCPFVHGVMIGDGPLLDAVQRQAAAAGLLDRLTFAGMLPGARRYLQALDALVLTSRTEGTPMVLLEAMWASVPIIATAVGGVPQLVGPTGAILHPPGDVSALAAALQHLSGNVTVARDLAAAGRARVVADYGYERWIDTHTGIYRAAFARASGRG